MIALFILMFTGCPEEQEQAADTATVQDTAE
jgi:hypothetical protein